MVLDAKFMEWAGGQGLDTAKLKAAKVPMYGKWYFPIIPDGIPMVNLRSGVQVTFATPNAAGETLFAPLEDLQRAGLWPPSTAETGTAAAPVAIDPLSMREPQGSIYAAQLALENAEEYALPVGALAMSLILLLTIIYLWVSAYITLLTRG